MAENSLIIFSKGSQMLMEATTIQKAKELKDLALTAKDWAKRKNLGNEAIQYCRSYALEAERKMGEMLKDTERAVGTDKGGKPSLDGRRELPSNPPPTLFELGLTKRESSEAQFLASLPNEEFEDVKSGKTSKKAAKKRGKQGEKEKAKAVEVQSAEIKPVLYCTDGFEFDPGPVDLLLTDPPYSTDVENIREFAPRVLDLLVHVKSTGRAYIFIGPYPEELYAYLSAPVPPNIELSQVLVWTYRNTLGPAPKHLYKNNWQAILYFIGDNAAPLDCPSLNELFSVQDINAPDGRLGDRYHAWQKPTEIAERFIRHSTKPGDLVYDPFTCTGTFLISAAKLGRRAIGCEINEEMIEIAKSRGINCEA